MGERKCKACKRNVKGHEGPCGVGKCTNTPLEDQEDEQTLNADESCNDISSIGDNQLQRGGKMVDLDVQEDPTESSRSKKKMNENDHEEIDEENEEETVEPAKKMGRKKKTSKEESGTESEEAAKKSKRGRKKKEALDNSKNGEDFGENDFNDQNSERSARDEKIDAPESDVEEEEQNAAEKPGMGRKKTVKPEESFNDQEEVKQPKIKKGKQIRETPDDPESGKNRTENLETPECSGSSDNLKDSKNAEARDDEAAETSVFSKSSEVACDSTEEACDSTEKACASTEEACDTEADEVSEVEEEGDVDFDKSEDLSVVEGENMSDNLDNSLFKLHKKSAGKNSFSPQKTLNGARHRIKSKSDEEFDVRDYLKDRTFQLCGCNYFSDADDDQFACECSATIEFNEKLTGIVTDLYKTPDESEDFLPMFKPGKSSWNKNSPNHVTLQMYKSSHPEVKKLMGEIHIRGEKLVEMQKRRKVLFIYITADLNLTLTGSAKFLKKVNYPRNPVKFKNLTVDLIFKESGDQWNGEEEKSPEHVKTEEEKTGNDEEENAEANDDACSKKDSQDEEEDENEE